ncbi:MAG: ATP-binding protein [Candidatus Wallbacteria bacterium]|nr:ATP-binding protein [Candidatus Wallbacteria bacterium]
MLFDCARWEHFGQSFEELQQFLASSREYHAFLRRYALSDLDRQTFTLLLCFWLFRKKWRLCFNTDWPGIRSHWVHPLPEFHSSLRKLCTCSLISCDIDRAKPNHSCSDLIVMLMPHVRHELFDSDREPYKDAFSMISELRVLFRERENMTDRIFMEELECIAAALPPGLALTDTLEPYTTAEKGAFLYCLYEFFSLGYNCLLYDTSIGYEGQDNWPALSSIAEWLYQDPGDRLRFMVGFLKTPIVRDRVMLVDSNPGQPVRISKKVISCIIDGETALALAHKTAEKRKKRLPGLVLSYALASEMNGIIRAVARYERLESGLKKRFGASGMCVLFHGVPGTGKTASAHELAQRTKRRLIQVDISSVRECWYGSTQKNARKIFTDYRQAAASSKKTPILLLNEADAVISRRNHAFQSVDDTENALKNIFLEEMEQFPGILVATTNLIENIDPAFDRRFLVKLRFDLPDTDTRKKIWLKYLPEISTSLAKKAAEFNLAGGGIENVCRRLSLEQIFNGNAVTEERLLSLIREETGFRQENRKAGFLA